jgi:DNA repair protein RadC
VDYPRLALTSRALAEQPRNPLDPAPTYEQLLLDFYAAPSSAPSVTAEVIGTAEVFIALNATTANGTIISGRKKTKRTEEQKLRAVHRALTPYVDLDKLRGLVAAQGQLYDALRQGDPPAEVLALVELLAAMLTPPQHKKIRSPADAAAILMVEMAHLDQEELRTVLLDTKNQVQEIVTIYRGSVNSAQVRVGEVFKAAIRRNSAALILAHNHPSGDVTPSPEDILLTRQIVTAGELLDVQCLDHLVIGPGRWTSLRERGQGFSKSL